MKSQLHKDRRIIRLLKQIPLYIETRPWRDILPALPAILAVLCIVLPVLASHASKDELLRRYKDAFHVSMEAEDYDSANMFLAKLRTLAPSGDPRIAYEGAMLAQAVGDIEHCRAEMRRLASPEGGSFGDAALWVAEDLYADALRTKDDSELEEVVRLLEVASNGTTNAEHIERMLATITFQQGNLRKSIGHWTKVARTNRDAHLNLAYLHKALGEDSESKSEFVRAIDFLKERLIQAPDNLNVRLQLSAALQQVNEFQSAERLLLEVFDPQAADPQVVSALSNLYAVQSDLLRHENKPASLLDSLNLLQRALRLNPTNTLILAEIDLLSGR
ncbi:MAG: hypothetical protein R3C05_10140 [Pirellulaceae bacterium]